MKKSLRKLLPYFVVLFSVTVFLAIKFGQISIRFGDSNAYIYMTKALWDGLLPYKDFFLADPPFLVLFLSFLRIFFQNNFTLYQAVPIVLEAVTAIVLYFILRKQKNSLAFLVPVIYLFTFSVLATSNFITGVQLVVFLSSLGFYLYLLEKPVLTGISWGLASLTKMYMVPSIFGSLIYFLLKKDYRTLKFLIMGGLLSLLILIPFLQSTKIFENLISHQLNRPGGLNKLEVLQFFVQKEWFLVLVASIGMFLKRMRYLVLPFFTTLLFFLIFKDLYYLYLNYLVFFLCLFAVSAYDYLWKLSENSRPLVLTLLFIHLGFIVISFNSYQTDYLNRGRFLNYIEIANFLKQEPNKLELYGSYEVVPLVALLSERKLFNNLIDTNGQVFASGALDKKKISEEAVNKGVFLIARITDLPEHKILDFGYQSYFDEEIFRKYCSRVKEFSSTSKEDDNKIIIYRCQR